MKLKAHIKAEKRYVITLVSDTGARVTHENCTLESEWNNLQCFVTEDGRKVITTADNKVVNLLSEIFNNGEPVEADVIRAAPTLIPTGGGPN
jgi:hypothetical protein